MGFGVSIPRVTNLAWRASGSSSMAPGIRSCSRWIRSAFGSTIPLNRSIGMTTSLCAAIGRGSEAAQGAVARSGLVRFHLGVRRDVVTALTVP